MWILPIKLITSQTSVSRQVSIFNELVAVRRMMSALCPQKVAITAHLTRLDRHELCTNVAKRFSSLAARKGVACDGCDGLLLYIAYALNAL